MEREVEGEEEGSGRREWNVLIFSVMISLLMGTPTDSPKELCRVFEWSKIWPSVSDNL